jgi:hypothetical protein
MLEEVHLLRKRLTIPPERRFVTENYLAHQSAREGYPSAPAHPVNNHLDSPGE